MGSVRALWSKACWGLGLCTLLMAGGSWQQPPSSSPPSSGWLELSTGRDLATASPPPSALPTPTQQRLETAQREATARRDSAIARRRLERSAASAVEMVESYFPGLGASDAAASSGAFRPGQEAARRALGVKLLSTERMLLDTRGLSFEVTRVAPSPSGAELHREGSAQVADPDHLWFPAGRLFDTADGWRAARVDEAWVFPDARGTHRAEYDLALPPTVTRVHDAGDYLELLDAAGRPVLRFHPSEVRDAEGRARRGGIALEGATPTATQDLYAVREGHLRIASEVRLDGLRPPLVVDPGWSSTASLASARNEHGMTLLSDGRLLVVGGIGGEFANIPLTSTELFDPQTGTWSAGPEGPASQISYAVALPNGQVLVSAGAGSTAFDRSAVFDPVANTWLSTGESNETRLTQYVALLPTGKVLVAGGVNGTADLFDPATRTYTPTGPMTAVRGDATTAQLADGRVVVAGGLIGGSADSVTSAELYDPATGTWSLIAPMPAARSGGAGTLLRDGRLLVAGGYSSVSFDYVDIPDAALYDPTQNSWTATGPLATARAFQEQVRLPSGRVLAAIGHNTATAERFDPATSSWSPAGALVVARSQATATVLPSGKAIVVGGWEYPTSFASFADAEIDDVDDSVTQPTGALDRARAQETATLLPDGRVLAVGGAGTGSASLYDPATKTWSTAPAPAAARARHQAVLLQDGRVLVMGGVSGSAPVASAELFDPQAGTWTSTAAMAGPRADFTATLLPSGKVLVAGGTDGTTALATAELFDPQAGTWSPAHALTTARSAHIAALLRSGKVLVAGGTGGGSPLSSAELYDPATDLWSPAAPLATARSGAAATVLGSGDVLVTGGSGAGAPASAERYQPASDLWSSAGTLTQPRTGHSATLLSSGLVLVAGGEGAAAQTSELYDPALGTWSAGVALASAHGQHAAVALADQGVLLAGGQSGGTPSAQAERVAPISAADAWRPKVTGPDVLFPGCPATITGERLGFPPAGGDDRTFAAPVIDLMPSSGGGLTLLSSSGISPTAITVTPPADLPLGHYTLSVNVSGVSGGRVVRVREDKAPVAADDSAILALNETASFTLSATSETSPTLTYAIVTPPAHGTLSGTPPAVVYTPDSGFSGADSFQFQATSACGHPSNLATVSLVVGDQTAPTLTCPSDYAIDAVDASGAPARYPPATATDDMPGTPTVTFSPANGGTLPIGTTTVTATATDGSGNQAQCQFQVTVRPLTSPPEARVTALQGGGCSSTGAGPLEGICLSLLGAFWLLRRRSAPSR